MIIDTRIATLKDFLAIAALIEKSNRNSQTQCIHSGTGESVASMLAEMEKWHQSGEIVYVKALEGDRLIGTMGCEYESDGRRGWLRGPFSESSAEGVFSSMYDRLRGALPSGICRLDSFLNLENRIGQAFYEQQGFERKGQSHVYVAARPAQSLSVSAVDDLHCVGLTESTHAGFAALHDMIFPNTYYNGRQIIEQLDENHRVWICLSDGAVLGYIYTVIESWAAEGYVEFLGVREDARGRGMGGVLLTTALTWFFNERKMPKVGLTVSDENVDARGLYKRVGFRLKYTGVNHRLEW